MHVINCNVILSHWKLKNQLTDNLIKTLYENENTVIENINFYGEKLKKLPLQSKVLVNKRIQIRISKKVFIVNFKTIEGQKFTVLVKLMNENSKNDYIDTNVIKQ